MANTRKDNKKKTETEVVDSKNNQKKITQNNEASQNSSKNRNKIKMLSYFICIKPEKKDSIFLNDYSSISARTFVNSSVENVFLKEIETIEESSFENCKKLSLISWYDFSCKQNNKKEILTYEDINQSLPKITKKVTAIRHSAFKGCEKLETVIFPKNRCVIEKDAFAQCKALRTVVLPGGDTEIAGDPFIGCKDLTIICKKGDSKVLLYGMVHSIRVIEID